MKNKRHTLVSNAGWRTWSTAMWATCTFQATSKTGVHQPAPVKSQNSRHASRASLQIHIFSDKDEKHSSLRELKTGTHRSKVSHFCCCCFSKRYIPFLGSEHPERPPFVRISASVGSLDSNMEETSRLFLLENIKTTPRNSFHKSCRYTGTRNPHSKRKTSSKIY